MKFNLLIFLTIFIFMGCESKNHILFSKNQELTNIINNHEKKIYRYKIRPYDRISVLFYEHPDLSTRKVGDFQEDTVGILVNADGTASFPLIGDLNVEGMFVDDLKKKIEELASEFIINPSVNINIINHRVFVLGEVNRPGTIKVTNTTISIFEVLSSSGGLSDTSKKNEVLIIRGDLNKPDLIKLDLTNFQNLTSNDLQLQPYDIVYVNPSSGKTFNITINELFPFIQLIESATGSSVNIKSLN
ncbi:polysaccharide biosynthesis/export family protein [Arcobacter sp. s6]|jgi:polysaccharide biosynthesis/export protein|uniref:polysaccharide biosynthesis/export family protein n=1 Tax=Arcobacter sp. s6 TaxID=3230363 RepID=UPI0034A084FB